MLTTELISSIQRRAAVPLAQGTFSSTDFYSIIDEVIESKLMPLVLSNLEEFYVADYPYNITAGVKAYQIPARATGVKLRDVQVISSTNPDSIAPLDRLDVADLYVSGGMAGALRQKSGFYLKGNSVIIYPTPTVTKDILNLEYYTRPSSCVDPTVCAQITAIDLVGNTVTVLGLPANITTATLVDFVKATPGFECTAIDQTITNIATNVLTFSVALPTSLSVGDYVCQATKSCVVQAPQELLPLVAQYGAVQVLSGQGDLQALQDARSELEKLEKNAMMLISPRVDGKPKRVTNARGISRFV